MVEILSQDKQRDRVKKFSVYEKYGIREYWIIEPEDRTIEIITLEKNKLVLNQKRQKDEPIQSAILKGFSVSYQGILDRKRS